MSAAAQADLDSLLDSSLSVAQRNLERASEFLPFAIFTSTDGKFILVEFDRESKGKAPDVDAVLSNLVTQLRTVEAEARCTAVVLNSRLDKDRADAIEVRLEHRDGGSLVVLLPYKRPLFGGKTEFGKLHGYAGKRLVWA